MIKLTRKHEHNEKEYNIPLGFGCIDIDFLQQRTDGTDTKSSNR